MGDELLDDDDASLQDMGITAESVLQVVYRAVVPVECSCQDTAPCHLAEPSGHLDLPSYMLTESHWWAPIHPEGLFGFRVLGDVEQLLLVSLPRVECIRARAFLDCSALLRVNIPDSVTAIGDRAFANCRSLRSIDLPNSVPGPMEYGDL